MKLSEGLQAYSERAKEILSWMPDWLHQNEFDKLTKQPYFQAKAYVRGAYLLGDMFGLKEDLHLLQFLVQEGFVERRGSMQGEIYYKAIVDITDDE